MIMNWEAVTNHTHLAPLTDESKPWDLSATIKMTKVWCRPGGMGTEREHSRRTVYCPNWRVPFPGLPCDNIVTKQHEHFLLNRLPWNSAVILVKKTQRDMCWMNSFSRLCVNNVRHNSLHKNEGKSPQNNHILSLGQWILRFLPQSAFKETREPLKSHRQEAEGNTTGMHTGLQVMQYIFQCWLTKD